MADEVQIDALSIAIEHSANDAANNLDELAKGLTALKKSVSRLNLSAAATSLRELGSASSLITKYSADNLSAMAIALTGISAAPKISSTVGKNIGSIAEAANALDPDSLANIERLGTVLKPLSELGRAQLTSFINQLGKLPQVARELDSVDMDKFAASIERTAAAIKPLADEMDKVSRGFSAFPTKIQAIIRNNEKLTASTKNSKSEFKKLFDEIVNGSKKSSSSLSKLLNTATALVLIRKGTKFIADAVDSANTYIEDLNLFNVAMGEYTQQAYDYAELVSEKMGIDPAQWMRMQAVLMDMSKSFGVASGTAYTMSKALTQLTYDISSLYNLKIDEAANKIRSALSGEIEPVRNLGKDLSVANLQLIATELGINKNVAAMTQAEKSMLRTIALLKQSDSAMGDLSRTLDQPANQLRILNAQLTLLKRSLGEMFLPMLQTALPYAIAAVKVLRLISVQLASLAGFTLPTFDLSDSTGSMTDYTDSVESAVEATQKLYQLSFDQLNILGTQGGAASGASSADLARLEEELNRLAAIEDYKFMENVESASDAIVKSMTEWLTKGQGIEAFAKELWEDLIGVKDTFVGIVSGVGDFFTDLGIWKGDLETVRDIIYDVLNGIDRIGIAVGLWDDEDGVITKFTRFAAVLGGIKIAVEIGKVLSYILTLGGLNKSVKSVTDAFDKKNKSLTQQTKDTVAETSAAAEMATTLATVALAAMGLATVLAKNPLVPDVNPKPILQSYGLIDTATSTTMASMKSKVSEFSLKSLADISSWSMVSRGLFNDWGINAIDLFSGTGAYLNDEWVSTLTGLNSATEDGYNSILDMTEDFGESLYNSIVNPMLRADSEYANICDNMFANYKALMNAMEMNISTSFTASRYSSRGARGGSPSLERPSVKSIFNANASYANRDITPGVASGIDAREWIMNQSSSKVGAYTDAFVANMDSAMEFLKKLLQSISVGVGVPAYASGGLPEDGLFFANSSELLGTFSNGRTAVANNAQIVEGIQRGVYSAVLRAMQETRGGQQSSIIVLDDQVVGKTFGAAIDRERRRSGTAKIEMGGAY